MGTEVEFTDEFGDWCAGLSSEEQDSVRDGVELLRQYGVSLPFPYSSGVTTSRHGHVRELRIQHAGRPLRVLYAFNPLRTGILLVRGDKTGNER